MRVRTFVIGAVNIAVIGWFLLALRTGTWNFFVHRADFSVYVVGGKAWLRGAELYGELPDLRGGISMPFTYPLISAVLFTPFTVVPYGVASALITVLTIAAVAVVLAVTLRTLGLRWQLLFWVLPVALVVEPVRYSLYLGQINALLMALVVVDCLVRRPRWPRGVLVGLAAAIKLTPALFVLFFLIRGDRKAALMAGVSFLCWTGLGFLLGWRDSVRYWTSALFDTERVGEAIRRSNQSITGLLARFGIESSVLWVLLSVALLVLAAIGMRRAFAAGQPVLALSLCALGALPLTPISWCHHWVWCVPVLLCLGVAAWRDRAPATIALAASGVVLFVLSPHWWWVEADPWPVERLVLGNLYVAYAVVVLAWHARPQVRTRTGSRHESPCESAAAPPASAATSSPPSAPRS